MGTDWNKGNTVGQQGKPMPNLNNMTPTQKSQTHSWGTRQEARRSKRQVRSMLRDRG
jgi:hypothetical protein